MSKKGLIVLIFSVVFVLFLASFAFALENESADSIAKAYTCLKNKISEKNVSTLSLGEATFSVLALGRQDLLDRVKSFKDDSYSCWPKGACKLKETAQALLAYKRTGQDTTSIKDWLLSKNTTASELEWLLEIDTDGVASSCTVTSGQKTSTITISEDAKIQGNLAGSCFTLALGDYMLKVTSSSSCLRNNISISCDKNFVTSMLYKKVNGDTLFVLPEATSVSPGASTTEKINGECLRAGTSGACDYEGTLWAAFALNELSPKVDVSRFIPYLLASEEDNVAKFPSAFLYMLLNGPDQFDLIMQQQKQGQREGESWWEVSGSSGKFYDTSLAMWALGGKTEIASTMEYLLKIQGSEGCWNNNNVRDTAFILYSGWLHPPEVVIGPSPGALCEPTYSCENLMACLDASGTVKDGFECPAGKSCCTVKVSGQPCTALGGQLCASGQTCTGTFSDESSDGRCCVGGVCEAAPPQVTDTCTPAGGTCETACGDNEEPLSQTCLAEQKCCIAVGGGLSAWIYILIVLIILTALGIIFRNKLKMSWYKIAERFKKKPIATQPSQRPMMPGQQFGPYPRQMMPQRPMIQPAMQTRAIRPVPKDKEMEDALKKLREMAKK